MPEKVAIVTDTTSCIPETLVQKYEIELVPLEFIFEDKAYRDGIDMTPTEFYDRLRLARTLPTTSGSLPGPFLETFRRVSQRTHNILCITVSAKLSGMFSSAKVAKGMAEADFPEVNVELLDCDTAAAAQGFVVLTAARKASEGGSLTESLEAARHVMRRVYLLGVLDTLHYLAKGGRVPKAAALANTLLNIKPIFAVEKGEAHPVALRRTKQGAVKQMMRLMAERTARGRPLHVAVMHASAPEEARKLEKSISECFSCVELFTTEFTPAMGVHTGPGVLAIAFYAED